MSLSFPPPKKNVNEMLQNINVQNGKTDVDGTQILMTTVMFTVILARKCEAEQDLRGCPEFSHFLFTSQNNMYLEKITLLSRKRMLKTFVEKKKTTFFFFFTSL